MPKIRIYKSEYNNEVHYHYMCPGCDHIHSVGSKHTFNGDINKPTFRPSLLADFDPGKRCHSFITDGFIKFELDSYHELKGQTVELPDIH